MVKERVISSWFVALAALLEAGASLLLGVLGIRQINVPPSAALSLSCLVFLIPTLLSFLRGEYPEYSGVIAPRDLILSALLGVSLIPPASALALLFSPISGNAASNLSLEYAGLSPFETLFFFGMAAPMVEELFFRGLVLGRYAPVGTAAAVFTSAFLFGLFHLNVYQLSYGFFLGLVFAWLTLRDQSILPALCAHIAFNLVQTFILIDPSLETHLSFLCTGSLVTLAFCTVPSKDMRTVTASEPEEGATLISPSFAVPTAGLIIFLVFQAAFS